MPRKKSTQDAISDIIEGLATGKGLDINDIGDLVSGAASGKKSTSGKKKTSKADDLVSLFTGGADDYPQLSEKNYWAIRAKFQKSIPEKVQASTLTTATGMKAESVRSSVLPALNAMGLINDDGKPTGRLKAWVDDSKYAAACAEILEKTYPSALRKLDCGTKTEQNAVVSWFKKNADASETAAKKMMGVYKLLSEPELKEAAASKKTSASKSTSKAKASDTDNSLADIKSGVTVVKNGKKATIVYKVTVPEDIKKGELKEKFEDALDKAFKKL